MKIAKTPQQLQNIQINAIQLIGGQIGNQQIKGLIPEDRRDSKAFIVFKRFISKSVEKPLSKIKEQQDDLCLDHALEQNGKLVRNEKGGFEYSREGQKTLNAALRKLSETPVEVDYDKENEPWDTVLALLPEAVAVAWSLEANEDFKDALEGFYA